MTAPFRTPDFASRTQTGVDAMPFVAIERDLARAESLWRGLEQLNPGRLFQRFDWVASWFATQGRAQGASPVIAVGLAEGGGAMSLFPFSLRRRAGLSILGWPGDAHSSFNMPLVANSGPLFAERISTERFLRTVARAVRADAFALINQPAVWDGAPHPFCDVGAVAAPDRAWERALIGGGEAMIARILNGDARKKLRSKERKLAGLGGVRIWRAATQDEAFRALDAFFSQKAARFRSQGLPNPFAEPGGEEFLRRAALMGIQSGQPAIALHALSIGERILAVFGGAEDDARFSGMFTSFDDAPDVSKCSPGDVLLRHLVAGLSDRGVQSFDLGVGDARYKRAYCDVAIPMFDTYLGCTASGVAAATIFKARAAAKRIVKQNSRLARLVQRFVRRSAEP
ncbi:MAG: GNAT family N-acetyltransferase [Beijerinckiaceae bacterium]